jgi:hypothetical protein
MKNLMGVKLFRNWLAIRKKNSGLYADVFIFLAEIFIGRSKAA